MPNDGRHSHFAIAELVNLTVPKGRVDESRRIGRLKCHHLAQRYIGSIRGVDIALYRDERLELVTGDTLRRDLSILSQVFEVS